MLQASSRSLLQARSDAIHCRELIKTGSRSFYTASWLLPESVRSPAYALYAFCRLSDDAVDRPGARADAVDHLRKRLDLVYQGKPMDVPADRAFADTVARFDMPKTLPSALLEGLAWDVEGRRCRNLAELEAYSARVAGTVGTMMTVLMDVRDADTLARACDLGIAMQMTNIARDVGEDARNGRIYLPLDWLADVGLDPDRLMAEPVFDDRVGELVSRLLSRAEALYDRSLGGISGLPVSCRPAIHAARLIYREIGRGIAANGYDSISNRAVVSSRRKRELLGQAVIRTIMSRRSPAAPPPDEAAFLVEAVPVIAQGRTLPRMSRAEESVGFVIELMERLEQRDRMDYTIATSRARAAD